jgi:hypothetical protein
MAGFGNQTAPDYTADSLTDQHDSTRLGLHTSHNAYSGAHPRYGSGATGGAGFGTSLPHLPIPPVLFSHSCPLILIRHTPIHQSIFDIQSRSEANPIPRQQIRPLARRLFQRRIPLRPAQKHIALQRRRRVARGQRIDGRRGVRQ